MAKSKPRTNVKNINKSAGNSSPNIEWDESDGIMESRTLANIPAGKEKPPIIPCGIPVLDNITDKTKPVEWAEVTKSLKDEKELFSVYAAEQVVHTANSENTPLVELTADLYYFTGTHYVQLKHPQFNTFLIEGARQAGVPFDTALCDSFVKKVGKQILISAARTNGGIVEPDEDYINLKNGTCYFENNEFRFVPHSSHSSQKLIRHCLRFEYDPSAKAPLWQEHLDRSLPNPEKQEFLAECLALPFYGGKIEKSAILYGEHNTGKSTTLDVYRALVGSENCTAVTLAALTRITDTGDYMRSKLDGKLVNIASDVGNKVHDEGLAKTLMSREMITVRNIGKQPFDMVKYARLVFAMNNLPVQFFSDPALTRRVAIIAFDQKLGDTDIKTGFTEEIIVNELPGVLNWILDGLDRLRNKGRLDPPACCIAEMERMRADVDPLSSWLDERRYQQGCSEKVAMKGAFKDFVEYCKDSGFKKEGEMSNKMFAKRLRALDYTVNAPNNRVGLLLYYTKCEDVVSLPPHSQITPAFDAANTGSGSNGSDGSENLPPDISKKPQAKPKAQPKARTKAQSLKSA